MFQGLEKQKNNKGAESMQSPREQQKTPQK